MTTAVILCAGKSTRTHPLTLTRPKALLPIANTTILGHTLSQLVDLVDETVLVVGYKKEMIQEHFGDSFAGMKLIYVEQKEQKGTGHALLQAREHVSGKCLVMNGDDLYAREDLERCLSHNYCILAKEVEDPSRFGILVTDGDQVKQLVEKPKNPQTNLANIGVYVVDDVIFSLLEELKESPRGEYEITDAITALAAKGVVKYETAQQYWIPIGYAWDLLTANELFVKQIEDDRLGEIEAGATLKGAVVVGEGTVIKSGAYIEGPVIIGANCTIGPNCYIRPGTRIGDGCKIGNAVEIKSSLLFDNVTIKHLSYIGDSVIGSGANLGAGTIVANFRHDGQNMATMLHGKKVETGRRKLGVILGDAVHTAINTSFYPARKMWPHTTTLPGEVVKEDKLGE